MTLAELTEEILSWRLTPERVVHVSIGIAALCVYEFIARPYYRPYIYEHQINDFHIADTLGNSLGAIATIWIFIGVFGRTKAHHIFIITTSTIGIVLYELAHPLLGKPIDVYDIIASIISGGFCYVLYQYRHSKKSSHAVSLIL